MSHQPPTGDVTDARAPTRRWRNRWRRAVMAVAVIGLVSPALRDRDSFPLSTYPVYASTRPSTAEFATAVGVRADGRERRLSMSTIAATDDPLIAASRVADAVASGRGADLCRQIADRAPRDVTEVLVVTERHNLVRAARGDRSRLVRTVHASCGRP